MSDLIQTPGKTAVLAPLAGISNLPFRLMAREFGCGVCLTEMISANGLIRESAKTIEYLQTCPEDRPLGVQLFGSDPLIMARAAKVVESYQPEFIDINMGCPVRKVVKTGSGAMLLKDPPLAGRIIEAVVKAVRVPVTVKIRAGWSKNSINALEMSSVVENSGAAAISVHGRTADQGFSGHADWSVIARVKENVKIPVIGNGDIWQPSDALKMVEQTGCDAVMVGRGALGNPWIFRQINQLFAGDPDIYHPTTPARQAVIKRHWDLEERFLGIRIASRSFRKHLLWYTRGLPGSGRFRETVGRMTDNDAIFLELHKYFQSLAGMPNEIRT